MVCKRLALVVPVLLAFTVGCGTEQPIVSAHVKGEVTYRDKSGAVKLLTGGSITFYPADGPPYSIPIREDGSFETTDLPTGPMIVTVENNSCLKGRTKASDYRDPNNPRNVMSNSPLPGEEEDGPPVQKAAWFAIPEKYSRTKTTPLTAQLKPGVNSVSFELED
jgi:hypothetical protein